MLSALLVSSLALALANPVQESDGGDSGTPLRPTQACFDVLHYDLNLRIDPEREAIGGFLTMTAQVLTPRTDIELDLHENLEVQSVKGPAGKLRFQHEDGVIRIETGELLSKANETFEVTVEYGGKPRVAPRPPWDGGFTWAASEDGSPWIATSCQGSGADLWWPCKDHPSDEPDGMDLRFTVPKPLVVASNGRLQEVIDVDETWHTYHWKVTTPINNYGVALNVARYKELHAEYESVTGKTMPVTYWVLPENVEMGKTLIADIAKQMRFFEEIFGPYPFASDKYGVVETPHLGMEHQTIIAYGNRYSGNPWGKDWGFDFLHYHEAAHEWWANLVTVRNWKDFWIHESFATYSQSLYVESQAGFEGYLYEIHNLGLPINRFPISSREPRSSQQMYFSGTGPGGDIYYKGAVVLHTLRWVMGDETFFQALRRMAYPDPSLENTQDGSACRLTDTQEFIDIVNGLHGESLDWFFEAYIYQAELPTLLAVQEGDHLALRWDVPNDLPFPMPIPVEVNGEMRSVPMPAGEARIPAAEGTWKVDPDGRVLSENMERRLRRKR